MENSIKVISLKMNFFKQKICIITYGHKFKKVSYPNIKNIENIKNLLWKVLSVKMNCF